MNKLWTDKPTDISLKPFIQLSTLGYRHGPKHIMKFIIIQWVIFGLLVLFWFELFGVPTLESIKSVGPSNILKIVRGDKSDENMKTLFESQKTIKWVSNANTATGKFINTDPKISYIYHMNASLGDAFSHSLSALLQSLENSQDDNVKNAILLSITKNDLPKTKKTLSSYKDSMKGRLKMLIHYVLPNVQNSLSLDELNEYSEILPNVDGLVLSLKTSKADELNWNAVYYIRKFMNEVKDVWKIEHFLFEIQSQFEHSLIESMEALLSINWFHRVTNTLFILPSYPRKDDLSEFLSNDRLVFKEETVLFNKKRRNSSDLLRQASNFKMNFKNVNVDFGQSVQWKSDYCVILHKY
ncbi:DgyrCDS1324 [Dimorphilus gyrociliatus]|uniref:DgyrCDS1324 n=1 Tax=Dimorphilus gyrociliatus TaxID=2664684 RepID=A0A7I8V923_9ANNE|nr:DgyrCDS1324 [Dimorphilus gyrociliatus]